MYRVHLLQSASCVLRAAFSLHLSFLPVQWWSTVTDRPETVIPLSYSMYCSGLKGQFAPPNEKYIFLSLARGAAYPSRFVSVSLVEVMSSLEYNGTRWCSTFAGRIDNEILLRETHQQRVFTEITSRLLKLIHRPRCEQFHVGTAFPLLSEGTYCIYSWERFALTSERDVNFNGVLLG